MAQQQVFKPGHSTILVHDDEFGDGYTNGVIGYPDQERPLTVTAIRNLIEEAVADTSHAPDWNTGYIAGAIKGILEGDYKQQEEPDAPRVQFGSLTLHLNRWRFRDGYYNGQHDYEAGHDERTSPDLLTARELLRYIAHRNPETNTYYFGEDELSALEDVLGQLVGYLCAALFPKAAQEHDTEPLQIAALQEA